jgi:hypothetical protein
MRSAARKTRPIEYLELHSGDHMTRAEFHRIYEQTLKNFKAELIGGIVFVASPLKRPHGTALFARNYRLLMKTLEEGMGTPEYAAFVEKLAGQHAGKKKKGRPRSEKGPS